MNTNTTSKIKEITYHIEVSDEFIKYVKLFKKWFKEEDVKVSDYVIGRMHKRMATFEYPDIIIK